MFIYSSHVKWPFPPLPWSFPPTTFTSFPTPGCWVCTTAPAFCGWLVYLQFHEGLPLPSSSALKIPCPLCYVSFLLLLFIQFLWGSVCPGGYAYLAQGCLWEIRVLLSSPCGLHLPKWSQHLWSETSLGKKISKTHLNKQGKCGRVDCNVQLKRKV
jgi:hypothetical protein